MVIDDFGMPVFVDRQTYLKNPKMPSIIQKSEEACSELSYSSGFVTGAEDGTQSSIFSAEPEGSLGCVSNDHPFRRPTLLSHRNEQSDRELNHPHQLFTDQSDGNLSYDDLDYSSASESHKTIRQPQLCMSPVISTISNHPFAHFARSPSPIGSESADKVMPLEGDMRLTPVRVGMPKSLSVAHLHTDLAQFHETPPVLSISPAGSFMETLFGCLKRPIEKLFLKNEESRRSSSTIEVQWEWPISDITDWQYVGSGAQGMVYRALLNGREIAFKKVNKQSEVDIRHLRGLSHPNVVQFIGVSINSPVFAILMEFCPNGTLYNLLHTSLPIKIAEIISWTKQIAEGMHYLHSHKVIHRDLKSPNILIGVDGNLKISDLGVSKEFNDQSMKMSFAGTVAWMAPEIMRGEPCSFKVDVWSFGVLLWEILTCEIPFNGVDYAALIYGVGSSRLYLPIPTGCPTTFRVLMKSCWYPKPRSRPSFQQILSHLEIACADLLLISNESFSNIQLFWQEEIHLKLNDFLREECRTPKQESTLIHMCHQELKKAQQIRRKYEEKASRADKLCQHLQGLVQEVENKRNQVEKEHDRYRQLIYQQSRGNTPFNVEAVVAGNINAESPVKSPAAKFRCQNCGTVSKVNVWADPNRKCDGAGKPGTTPKHRCQAWKHKLHRFASTGDFDTYQQDRDVSPASVNIQESPFNFSHPEQSHLTLSKAQPYEIGSTDQSQIHIDETDTEEAEEPPIREKSVSQNSLFQSPETNEENEKGVEILNSRNQTEHLKVNSEPSLKTRQGNFYSTRRLKMYSTYLKSDSSSIGSSSSTKISSNEKKTMDNYRRLKPSRPRSEDIHRKSVSMIHTNQDLHKTMSTSVHASMQSDEFRSVFNSSSTSCRTVIEASYRAGVAGLPVRSTLYPTLSSTRHSSSREINNEHIQLRQRPGRRYRSPIVGRLSRKSLTISSVSIGEVESPLTSLSTETSNSQTVTTSQLRRSIEELTTELNENMADSLSEKEKNIDLFEKQLIQATSRCPPALSTCTTLSSYTSSTTHLSTNKRRYRFEPSFNPQFAHRPWMSTLELGMVVSPSMTDDKTDALDLIFSSDSTVNNTSWLGDESFSESFSDSNI